VVIDVRNNNGGFVNVYALDVLARRPYLTMTGRGRAAGSRQNVTRAALARTADDPGGQSALALGR